MANKPIYIVVTPFFPSPTSWRGPFCLDFVKALKRTGKYDVRVFVPGSGEDYTVDGVRVYRFPTKQLPSNIFPFFFRRHNERSFLRKLKEVLTSTVDLHLQPTPDILTSVKICHAHTANFAIYPLVIKWLNPGCKTLLHHHDPQSFGLHLGVLRHCALYNVWLFCQMRRLFERMDIHVFISEMVKRSFLSAPDASWTNYKNYQHQMRGPHFFRCRPVHAKRSLVLHNGVDTSVFHSASEPRPSSSTFAIGCVGNFVDWKDQATLIRATGILSQRYKNLEIKVVFVGSGPTLSACKDLALSILQFGLGASDHSHLPRFEFRTEVPHEQLAEFYRSLDLFVLPSYFEGFGCVFTEAHACGVPFMTCSGQGMDDLVAPEERGKWLCRAGDAEGLANLISNYIGSRPNQKLSSPIAIDDLVASFLAEVES